MSLFYEFLLGEPSIGKSIISLISRIFPDISPDAGLDSKSIQKMPVLFHGYVTSFIWAARPLEPAVAQPKRKQAESYALKEQSFDSILFHATEEEQSSFFQGIQAVSQANNGSQTVDPSSKICSPAGQDHTSDPPSLPKHVESPRGSWPGFSRWSYFRQRPGSLPAGSWLPLKRESQDCLPEHKTMPFAVSVHRR